jgi:hypothetical protein
MSGVTTSHPYTPSELDWDVIVLGKGKSKGHTCTGTEALYRPYGP